MVGSQLAGALTSISSVRWTWRRMGQGLKRWLKMKFKLPLSVLLLKHLKIFVEDILIIDGNLNSLTCDYCFKGNESFCYFLNFFFSSFCNGVIGRKMRENHHLSQWPRNNHFSLCFFLSAQIHYQKVLSSQCEEYKAHTWMLGKSMVFETYFPLS